MEVNMSKPQINHIKTALESLYSGRIELHDFEKATEDERQKAFYSRSLAAYSLYNLASINVDESIESITDGYNDNGIDAIFYDDDQCILYVVQSKYFENGTGEPESGDLRKFKDGIFDLVEERFDRFNKKINKRKNEIQSAFAESKIKLNIILAYTGRGFSEVNNRIITDIIDHLNDSTEWAFFTDYNVKAAHESVTLSLSGKTIDTELMLSNWGTVEEPYTAYYGQVSAYDLALLWKDYRKKLFLDNIRSFLGISEINNQIIKTIQTSPDNFVYYNNGVTMLANQIFPLPARTVGKTSGTFACNGISIVNGAQTVGCLGLAIDKYPDQLKKCKVFIRLIPLENTPDEFSSQITIAANTQNRIEKRDFVSLDPIQYNLKTELALLGIHYHYKRTDEGVVQDSGNCSLEEATIALACLQSDPNYSVTAKREVGVFWDNIDKEPYRLLFNEKLKPETLWKSVLIYRRTMKFLSKRKNETFGRESSHYVFGNYLILNIVFEFISREHIFNPSFSCDDIINDGLDSKISDSTDNVFLVAEELYPTALMHQLYRNYSKCRVIKETIIDKR
jgi:hypothetical protein